MCHIQSELSPSFIFLLILLSLSVSNWGDPEVTLGHMEGSCMLGGFRLIMTYCINRDQSRLGLVSAVR